MSVLIGDLIFFLNSFELKPHPNQVSWPGKNFCQKKIGPEVVLADNFSQGPGPDRHAAGPFGRTEADTLREPFSCFM